MIFDFYMDPGHGWLKVQKRLLIQLGIAQKITAYSYQRGCFAYLEEDRDLSTFIIAMKKHGQTVEFRDHHTKTKHSKIRNYSSYASGQITPSVL